MKALERNGKCLIRPALRNVDPITTGLEAEQCEVSLCKRFNYNFCFLLRLKICQGKITIVNCKLCFFSVCVELNQEGDL